MTRAGIRNDASGTLDCSLHAVVRHAPAENAGHALANLCVSRRWIPREQGFGRQDLTVLTEPALRHLLVDPRLLHRIELALCGEPLERRDRRALSTRDRHDTRPNGGAFDENGARPALRKSATEARPSEFEIVTEDVQERRGRGDVDGMDS